MIDVSTATNKFIHTNFLSRQKVKRNNNDAKKGSLYIICMGLSFMIFFFIFLWVRIYIIETGYRFTSARNTNSSLIQENRKLRIEKASLSAPPRIEKIARSKLGMVIPDNSQMVVIKW